MELFHKIVNTLNLGYIVEEPTRVSGGLTHKMYKLVTSTGKYIVKLLNPNIMKRANALANFNKADNLEEVLQEKNIEAIYSLKFNDSKIQKIDHQYFYIYEWYDGKILKDTETTKIHCQKIGKVLSEIHNISSKEEKNNSQSITIDWSNYLEKANKMNSPIFDTLNYHINLLEKMISNRNNSITNLPNTLTICHNDMDIKNVLWINNDFKIIDLECLDYSNPYIEFLELSLCWSGFDSCNINFDLLEQFIKSYLSNSKLNANINWGSIYDCNLGRLYWLEYNIKRALLIECSSNEEQNLGIDEVKKTLKQITYYDEIKNKILNIFNNHKKED